MTQPRGQAVIDKILESANELFYKKGYNTTGINEIIQDAGVAKGTLYQHFQSKTDLLVGYIDLNQRGWFTRLKTLVDQTPDPKQKLLALFDYHIARQDFREYGGCPFIKANDEAGTSDERVLKGIQAVKQQFRDLIAELVLRSGHKKILTDEELTNLIFSLVEGGTTAASVFKNTADLEASKAIVQKLI
jgi:AcrR family transcriptional regulator